MLLFGAISILYWQIYLSIMQSEKPPVMLGLKKLDLNSIVNNQTKLAVGCQRSCSQQWNLWHTSHWLAQLLCYDEHTPERQSLRSLSPECPRLLLCRLLLAATAFLLHLAWWDCYVKESHCIQYSVIVLWENSHSSLGNLHANHNEDDFYRATALRDVRFAKDGK